MEAVEEDRPHLGEEAAVAEEGPGDAPQRPGDQVGLEAAARVVPAQEEAEESHCEEQTASSIAALQLVLPPLPRRRARVCCKMEEEQPGRVREVVAHAQATALTVLVVQVQLQVRAVQGQLPPSQLSLRLATWPRSAALPEKQAQACWRMQKGLQVPLAEAGLP